LLIYRKAAMTGSDLHPPRLETRPPIGQTSHEAIKRAEKHGIVAHDELLRYGARNRATALLSAYPTR